MKLISEVQSKMPKIMRGLCQPSFVYLLVNGGMVLYYLFKGYSNFPSLVLTLAKIGLMTYAIDYLCKHNYRNAAWAVVFIPYTLAIMQMLNIIRIPYATLSWMFSNEERALFGL